MPSPLSHAAIKKKQKKEPKTLRDKGREMKSAYMKVKAAAKSVLKRIKK